MEAFTKNFNLDTEYFPMFFMEVQCRRSLWDCRHPRYNDAVFVEKLWKEIASIFHLDSEICRIKFNEIRDAYFSMMGRARRDNGLLVPVTVQTNSATDAVVAHFLPELWFLNSENIYNFFCDDTSALDTYANVNRGIFGGSATLSAGNDNSGVDNWSAGATNLDPITFGTVTYSKEGIAQNCDKFEELIECWVKPSDVTDVFDSVEDDEEDVAAQRPTADYVESSATKEEDWTLWAGGVVGASRDVGDGVGIVSIRNFNVESKNSFEMVNSEITSIPSSNKDTGSNVPTAEGERMHFNEAASNIHDVPGVESEPRPDRISNFDILMHLVPKLYYMNEIQTMTFRYRVIKLFILLLTENCKERKLMEEDVALDAGADGDTVVHETDTSCDQTEIPFNKYNRNPREFLDSSSEDDEQIFMLPLIEGELENDNVYQFFTDQYIDGEVEWEDERLEDDDILVEMEAGEERASLGTYQQEFIHLDAIEIIDVREEENGPEGSEYDRVDSLE